MSDLIDLLKPDTLFELAGLCVLGIVFVGVLFMLAYLATKIRTLSAGQGRVEAQFSNNRGSTLKDAVDRLEVGLATHIAESSEVHAAIVARLDA